MPDTHTSVQVLVSVSVGGDCLSFSPCPSRACLLALILAEGGDKEEFRSWCVQHGRVYSSESEEAKGFEAYLSNRALVQELNQANRWVCSGTRGSGPLTTSQVYSEAAPHSFSDPVHQTHAVVRSDTCPASPPPPTGRPRLHSTSLLT